MGKDAKDWLKSVDERYKVLHKDWIKEAKETLQIYECKDPDKVPFNILYSNTETIMPALYNSTPRPDVSRRFTSATDDADKVSTAAAQVADRTLQYASDSNDGEYETYDEATRAAAMAALLPGLGQARVHLKDDQDYQSVCFESLAYDRFLWGYAKAWKHVPWVAYGHDLSRYDFEKAYPEAVKAEWYKKLNWEAMEEEARTEQETGTDKPNQPSKEPTLLVWEIWDWATKQIYHVTDKCPKDFVFQEEYPFRLTTKFPSPEPLRFIRRVNDLTPIPPYRMYASQAKELNELTKRLKKLAKAIQVRGIYNSSIQEFQQLFSDDSDNALLPSVNAAAFSEKGLAGNIWLIPIDMLVAAYQALSLEREAVKGTIFEIMGIGELQRGMSDPNDGVGTNQIKNQWSTLRTKRAQRDVQIFCRDLFRISLEFAANLFSVKTFKDITQLPYPYEVQKAQAQQMKVQFDQASQQFAQMQQQMQGLPPEAQQMTPLPPPPPPVPPEMLALLGMPTMEEACNVLRGQFTRQYRIDIETNSTIDLEATEDKQSVAEFMNAFGQMMSGFGPLLEENVLAWPLVKQVIKEVTKKFRFGRDIEDVIEQMQPPQPKPDPKNEVAFLKQSHQLELQQRDLTAQKQNLDSQQETKRVLDDMVGLQGENERLKIQNQIAMLKQVVREFELKRDFGSKLQDKEQKAAMALLTGKMETMMADMERELESRLEKLEHTHEIQTLEVEKDQLQIEADHKVALAEHKAETAEGAAKEDGKPATKSASPPPPPPPPARLPALPTSPSVDTLGPVLERLTAAIEAMSGPKKLIRDASGQIVGVSPLTGG